MKEAVKLVRGGFKLVPIPRGKKGPTRSGWQTEQQAIGSEDEAAMLNGCNLGLAHLWSGTCCIDVDEWTAAEAFLHARGVDLAALFMEPDAVQIHSGRAGRGKLLYRLPSGVRWLPTIQPDSSGLELRCATRDGTATVQDVLPPSIHPATGRPYEWRGEPESVSALPELPPALLALWRALAQPQERHEQPRRDTAAGQRGTSDQRLRDLRAALLSMRADDYHLWVRMGLALHELGDTGRELWIEWSATSEKFDPADAAKRWDTFNPIGTSCEAVFAEAQRRGWANPAKGSGAHQGAAEPPDDPQDESPERTRGEPLLVDLTNLSQSTLDAPEHKVERMMPAGGAVTLFGGHGGVGKSLLGGLQLAVSLATGRRFLGQETTRSRVLCYFCEDSGKVSRHRLARVVDHHGIDPDELVGRLRIFDMTEADPVLYREDRHGPAPTERYLWLRDQIEEFGADVLIVDNASDVYDASEISRPRVREFIRLLSQLMKPRNGAVVLLAHVDKSTAKAGGGAEGYSGSTAWNNSVRSRLYLYEQNGAVILEHQKANYGPKADPVRLHWEEGLLLEGDAVHQAEPLVEHAKLCAILRLIEEFTARGESIGTSPQSPSNAHRMLKNEKDYPARMPAADLFALLRDAERRRLIEREEYRTQDRKSRERWTLTVKGCAECANSAPGL